MITAPWRMPSGTLLCDADTIDQLVMLFVDASYEGVIRSLSARGTKEN